MSLCLDPRFFLCRAHPSMQGSCFHCMSALCTCCMDGFSHSLARFLKARLARGHKPRIAEAESWGGGSDPSAVLSCRKNVHVSDKSMQQWLEGGFGDVYVRKRGAMQSS